MTRARLSGASGTPGKRTRREFLGPARHATCAAVTTRRWDGSGGSASSDRDTTTPEPCREEDMKGRRERTSGATMTVDARAEAIAVTAAASGAADDAIVTRTARDDGRRDSRRPDRRAGSRGRVDGAGASRHAIDARVMVLSTRKDASRGARARVGAGDAPVSDVSRHSNDGFERALSSARLADLARHDTSARDKSRSRRAIAHSRARPRRVIRGSS